RPQTFDDVVGQEHITRTLKNAIEQNRLAHAYIFVGPRGTGKTSTARILAKALNCQKSEKPTTDPCGECDACREIASGNSLDVLEFDAASNTQVDKVRELIIDNVKYAPTRGRYKVYIVDEVHMLSTSSFNALLKTLEEPPEHVKFVFATTDVQKVPTTILSRCQRFDLKRIPTALIAAHLQGIAQNEKIELTPEAAESVARGAEGGMRDAESMLDQLVAFCGEKIDENDVLSVFGFTAQQTIVSLCGALIYADAPTALGIVHEQAEEGRDLSRLMTDLITHLRNLLVAQADPEGLAGELTDDAVATLIEQAGQVRMEKLLELIEQFAGAEQRMKWASNRKMHFEVAVIRAIQTLSQATLSEVLETLTAIKTGAPVPVRDTPARPSGGTPKPVRERPAVSRAAKPVPIPTLNPRVAEPQPVAAPEAPQIQPVVPVEEAIAPAPLPAAEEVRAPEAPAPVVAAVEPEPAPLLVKAAPISAEPEESPFTPQADEDVWPKLLAEVRKRRPLIAMWVESGVLLGIEGDTAMIGFPTAQTLASDYCQQPANRKFLEALLKELTGQELTLRCQMREGLVVTPPPAPEPEPVLDPLEQFKNDPLIRRALEIFKAEIQPA
ncbi:MAG: DNA polymerase III subunit gamma/tau, partial [Chthoniobacteraceae bacterium]